MNNFTKKDNEMRDLACEIGENFSVTESLALASRFLEGILLHSAMKSSIADHPDLDLKRQMLLTGNKTVAIVIEKVQENPAFELMKELHKSTRP